MSIERISRQSYINSYNKISSKSIDKANRNTYMDRIEISEIGKSLKEYSLQSESVDLNRIEDIKSKISRGIYNVDAKLTAVSILDAMKGCKL